ncbi:DEAD/DEAH box helicase [Devosia sp. SD17-2]|uniref:DEAD/DEAH box helicase n=1 Tax=Devosia sp. SD17-2 TaxID=2976459 RepID=UPI0023D8B7C5|nr:DEAD/DEAH box helicase [Devosia sp. SD17-2]WEJ34361.1 DEAD/DEAH box helicase [Devosia sp. SD17-2]
MTDFASLGLPTVITDSLTAGGFTVPTKIQSQAIPKLLEGRDMLGIAQTGSGKTAAFGLPILAGLLTLTGRPRPMTTRALILAPTRELAVQIDENIRKFAGAKMKLDTVLVLGGVSRYHQVGKIAKGVDIVVATPGRLKDLLDDNKIRLNETRWLVLDEADRMLDMGFIAPVKAIAKAIGLRRQTMLFSATMAPEIEDLTKSLLKEPVKVEAAVQGSTVVKIDQRVILSNSKAKRNVLNDLLGDEKEAMERVIVFARTKHGADRVTKNLAIDGHDAAAIHGNKSQNARQAALKGFSSGAVRILVATDIAARGIDVPGITHVVNYDLPDDPENYVHRIGRTGRNGATGIAITLCDGTERGKLRDVERLIRRTLPVSGDEKLLTEVESSAPRAPRNNPGAPGGARTARNPKANSNRRFNTPRPGGERGKGGVAREAVARDPNNALAPVKSVKPPRADGLKTKQRWTTAAKKTAARNRREG